MMTPLPGATPTKPGSCTLPFPGIMADIVDLDGNPVAEEQGGYLVVKHTLGLACYGRYTEILNVFALPIGSISPPKMGNISISQEMVHAADKDGYFWVMGRVDDVINISGHRLGTMEIESALVSHPAVAEAAVVGKPDEVKGEDIYAFITLEGHYSPSNDLINELKQHVAGEIGAIARPGRHSFKPMYCPKPRSGKIMRRLLRSLAAGKEVTGDTSTLEDRSVLDKLRASDED